MTTTFYFFRTPFSFQKTPPMQRASTQNHSFPPHKPHRPCKPFPCIWNGTCCHQKHRPQMETPNRWGCERRRKCQTQQSDQIQFHACRLDYVHTVPLFFVPVFDSQQNLKQGNTFTYIFKHLRSTAVCQHPICKT